MLVRGKICACSKDAFLVELVDIGFCNRIMKYESYLRIIEVLNEYNPILLNLLSESILTTVLI